MEHLVLRERGDGMGALDGGDDTLEPRHFIAGVNRLVVVDGENLRPALLGHVAMHRADAGIVQAGRDGSSPAQIQFL